MADFVPLAKASQQPITVVGCPKSGTTLVTQMLNNHDEFGLDFEIHLAFLMLERAFTLRAHKLVQMDYNDGMSGPWTRELIDSGAWKDGVKLLYSELHSGYRDGLRWGSTTKSLARYPEQVKSLWPDAMWIVVVRNPLDNFASFKKMNWNSWSWVTERVKSGVLLDTVLLDGFIERYNAYLELRKDPNAIVVKYESVIANPNYLYHRLGLTPPKNPLLGVGNVYQHRSTRPDGGPLVNSLRDTTDHRNDLTDREASIVKIECKWAFEEFYNEPV